VGNFAREHQFTPMNVNVNLFLFFKGVLGFTEIHGSIENAENDAFTR